mmetsp:Transcript_5940/g.17181  ORF Transcript_5940/g.17181 Transcript_5940/m.17181 type:complete len:207 (+) Transcript_5940:560-1180(+)
MVHRERGRTCCERQDRHTPPTEALEAKDDSHHVYEADLTFLDRLEECDRRDLIRPIAGHQRDREANADGDEPLKHLPELGRPGIDRLHAELRILTWLAEDGLTRREERGRDGPQAHRQDPRAQHMQTRQERRKWEELWTHQGLVEQDHHRRRRHKPCCNEQRYDGSQHLLAKMAFNAGRRLLLAHGRLGLPARHQLGRRSGVVRCK